MRTSLATSTTLECNFWPWGRAQTGNSPEPWRRKLFLSQARRWPEGHAQAADSIQHQISCALGLPSSWSISSSGKKDLLSACIRGPLWSPPVVPWQQLWVSIPCPSLSPCPWSPCPAMSQSSFPSFFSQHGLHCRGPYVRVQLTHTQSVYFALNFNVTLIVWGWFVCCWVWLCQYHKGISNYF